MWLVAGLGNPGAKYETTRHNFGFLTADALIDHLGDPPTINDEKIIIMKPDTFMNRSGEPIQKKLAFLKILPEKLIVLHDELDLPLGEMRIKKGGGHGGHNGLRDIVRAIGPDFIRIRLGIGRPIIKGNEADYVLSTFKDEEWPVVLKIIESAVLGIEKIIKEAK